MTVNWATMKKSITKFANNVISNANNVTIFKNVHYANKEKIDSKKHLIVNVIKGTMMMEKVLIAGPVMLIAENVCLILIVSNLYALNVPILP